MALQILQPYLFSDIGNDLCLSQTAIAGLPGGDRHLHQCSKGYFGPATLPRFRRPVQDRFRARAQDPGIPDRAARDRAAFGRGPHGRRLRERPYPPEEQEGG